MTITTLEQATASSRKCKQGKNVPEHPTLWSLYRLLTSSWRIAEGRQEGKVDEREREAHIKELDPNQLSETCAPSIFASERNREDRLLWSRCCCCGNHHPQRNRGTLLFVLLSRKEWSRNMMMLMLWEWDEDGEREAWSASTTVSDTQALTNMGAEGAGSKKEDVPVISCAGCLDVKSIPSSGSESKRKEWINVNVNRQLVPSFCPEH